MIEHKCKNCLLYNRQKKECRVALLIEGQQQHLPVFPEDNCHMEELGIEVEQVRWIETTDKNTNKKIVQIEYPENFFGKEIDGKL